ncbi:hypothetical protein EON77_21950, partial [bacterium]
MRPRSKRRSDGAVLAYTFASLVVGLLVLILVFPGEPVDHRRPVDLGRTLDEVGRRRPGLYSAYSTGPEEYPAATPSILAHYPSFTGHLVVRTREGGKGSIPFRRGVRIGFSPRHPAPRLTAAVLERFPLGQPVSEAIRVVPEGADARLVRQGEFWSRYRLPRDSWRFAEYTGFLMASDESVPGTLF